MFGILLFFLVFDMQQNLYFSSVQSNDVDDYNDNDNISIGLILNSWLTLS